MSTGLRLRPAVLAAREELAEGREKLRRQHQRGSPGVQLCARLTDLFDGVVLKLYRAAVEDLEGDPTEFGTVLVAHGGYGRRDVAPFSDVDLMLLYPPALKEQSRPLAQRLVQDLGDAGLDLGFSARTIRECCLMAFRDITIFTTLAEARLLIGSASLYTRFVSQFRGRALRRSRMLITRIDASRRQERRNYGDTVYLQKPNIKRSSGGLRDLQTVRWIGFARYGDPEPDSLFQRGFLTREDSNVLRDAREFLLRLRNEMHFFAGRAQDVLDRDEQVRLAERLHYEGDRAVRPVERFMRDYFEHTSAVRYAANHFVASSLTRSTALAAFHSVLSRSVDDGCFRHGPFQVGATRLGLSKLPGNLNLVLRLLELSNLFAKRIDHNTWQAIRADMMARDAVELTPQATERFLSLISRLGPLGDNLRRLHELRVLEKLVPPLSHARNRVQFNDYHKYTVDEHSIRAVECATEFASDPHPLGDAYRGLKEKRTLHLALLLHDLGKGYPDDHSVVGARLARETGEHLGLQEEETETLEFLVLVHLRMSHLAQQKDLNEQKVIVDFAVEVGSVERLQMLFVLTCADLAAVGPGVLNNWKRDLITELYLRTRAHLAGGPDSSQFAQRLEARREELRGMISKPEEKPWWDEQVAGLPAGYLLSSQPQKMVDELIALQSLSSTDVATWSSYDPQTETVQFTVGAHEGIVPGIFHRLTGVLTSCGVRILRAEIHTLAEHRVLDRFDVQEQEYQLEPPAERLQEIEGKLQRALTQPTDQSPVFRCVWQDRKSLNQAIAHLPTQVRFDNSTSDHHTLVTVFAYDRNGLLYAISRALYEAEVTVSVAKIGTYLDQVVDVFQVTDRAGKKITGTEQLQKIQATLFAAIAAVEEQAVSE